MINQLDPSSRPYVPSSMTNWTDFDPAFSLAPSDGPYGILPERDYYFRNPGLRFNTNHSRMDQVAIAFQPEVGNTCCPELESLRRFLSSKAQASIPTRKNQFVDPIWTYHKYLPFTDASGDDHIYAYGDCRGDLAEYAFRSQLAQLRQYQALFEGYAEHLFQWYSTIIMWKTQSPW